MESKIIINQIPDTTSLQNIDSSSDKYWYLPDIKITFIKIKGNVEIIEKNIPLDYLFESLFKLKEEYKENGIALHLNDNDFKIVDYNKLMHKLFRNQKIELIDIQRTGYYGYGSPDFKIIDSDKNEFFIEVKKGSNAGIGAHQLKWMAENKQDVWYMIIENFDFIVESNILKDPIHRINL